MWIAAAPSKLDCNSGDVANSMLISLSGSGQTAPNQWLNPVNGVNYQVVVQSPTYRIDSFDALQSDAGHCPFRK